MWSPASAMFSTANVSAAWPLATQEGAGAALERGDALLDDVLGRVLDAGVDVAELGQREQVRGVVGVVEDVRRRLVDRRGASLGHRVGRGAGVDLLGLETPVLGCGHVRAPAGDVEAAAADAAACIESTDAGVLSTTSGKCYVTLPGARAEPRRDVG